METQFKDSQWIRISYPDKPALTAQVVSVLPLAKNDALSILTQKKMELEVVAIQVCATDEPSIEDLEPVVYQFYAVHHEDDSVSFFDGDNQKITIEFLNSPED